MSMRSLIFTKNINKEKCYYIDELFFSKYYINKETGIPVKTIEDKNTFEIVNFKVNKLTDNDVERPNLEEYVIIEQ